MDKHDLRVKRTKKLLCEALLNLMENEPFNKISVNDICEQAMVHRATFYNHFTCKEDLLDCALDDIQEALFEKTTTKTTYTSAHAIYLNLASNAIDFIAENSTKILKIAQNSTEKLATVFLQTLERSILYLLGKNKQRENLTLPMDVIASFYTGGLSMLIMNWLLYHSHTKEELLSCIDALISTGKVQKL